MSDYKLNLLNFILIALPSGLSFSYVGPTLLGIYLDFKIAVINGILMGVLALIVRMVAPIGLNAFICTVILFVLLATIGRLSLRTAALASVLSTTIMFIGGNLFIIPTIAIFDISVEESIKIFKYRVIMTWISEVLPAVIVVFLTRRFNIAIYKAPEANK
jgi:uncharacterized membrane protein